MFNVIEEKKESVFAKTFLDRVYYYLKRFQRNLVFKQLDPQPEDINKLESVVLNDITPMNIIIPMDIYCEVMKYQYFDVNKNKFVGKVLKCYRLFAKANEEVVNECLKEVLSHEMIIPLVTPTYVSESFSRLYLVHAYIDTIVELVKKKKCNV